MFTTIAAAAFLAGSLIIFALGRTPEKARAAAGCAHPATVTAAPIVLKVVASLST